MQIKKLTVGQLKTNCYIVFDERSFESVIIDPGDDAEFIEKRIFDLKLTPLYIIATHAHFDHVLAGLELQLAFNVPFFMNKKDQFLLDRMRNSAKHFLGINVDRPAKVNGLLENGEEIKFGKSKLLVIETPGHTPGSCSLYSKSGNSIFVGDLIFEVGGVGRTDFRYSNRKDLECSIETILKLPDKTVCYSGHGESFSIKEFDHFWYNRSN